MAASSCCASVLVSFWRSEPARSATPRASSSRPGRAPRPRACPPSSRSQLHRDPDSDSGTGFIRFDVISCLVFFVIRDYSLFRHRNRRIQSAPIHGRSIKAATSYDIDRPGNWERHTKLMPPTRPDGNTIISVDSVFRSLPYPPLDPTMSQPTVPRPPIKREDDDYDEDGAIVPKTPSKLAAAPSRQMSAKPGSATAVRTPIKPASARARSGVR